MVSETQSSPTLSPATALGMFSGNMLNWFGLGDHVDLTVGLFRGLGMLVAVVFLVWLCLRPEGRSAPRSLVLAFLAVIALGPVVQPWYLLWGFGLFPLAPSVTMWVYSLTITFGYVYFATGRGLAFGETWTVNPWVLVLGYVPVLITLGIELWIRRTYRETATGVESSHAGC